MLPLMELPLKAYTKENLPHQEKTPSNMEIKAKNSCHLFQIFFEIKKKKN